MDAKHTPGPWRHEDSGHEFQYVTGPGEDETSGNIATCWSAGTDPRANARLIAAAPDLLDACERLLSYEPHITEAFAADAAVQGDMKALRAAIARARVEG